MHPTPADRSPPRPGRLAPLLLAFPLAALAQVAAPAPATTTASADGTGPLQLSPFLVSTEGDTGYRAANTLAGTRMNTSLFMTPAAVSVLTSEFLEDIGATRTEDFLRFSVSSDYDVGLDNNGNNNQWYDAPAKIRGFGNATVTRDYFTWALSSDVFNVERVDVNRGPNAVLYGIGAPGGVLNTSSKTARLNSTQHSLTLTAGSWDRKRAELDLAVPLVRNQLALRLNSVVEDRAGWRDFESFQQRGLAGAFTYQPFRHTTVRGGYERALREQVIPAGTPDDAGGTRWLAAGAPRAGSPLPGTNPAPALLRTRTVEQVFYAPQLRPTAFRLSTVGADMRPDLPGTQAAGHWDTVPGAGTLAQGNVDDPYLGTLIPANANLTGPGATTNNRYTVWSAFVEQRVGALAVELGYRRREYWRDNRAVGVSGILGDPNPILPGAYYADGDSRLAAGRAPGTLLPDIGAPNPYAGRLYVEGSAQTRVFDESSDQFRANAGYEFDLTRWQRWLGRHSLSALWQADENWGNTWVEVERNLAPNNNQPIDSATNTIVRRTYLDFDTPGGLRGALDPWAHPLEGPGVKSGFVYNAPTGRRRTNDQSQMIAGQSRFLGDRLALTGGYRRDTREDRRPVAGGQRLPNSTNLWIKLHDVLGEPDEFTGKTTTFGVFLSPFRRVGLTYNQANSVLPQSPPNPYGVLYGTRKGRGKDYGIRLNLLNDQLYLNVNAFTTDDVNRQTNVFVQQQLGMNQAIPAIVDALLATRQPLPASMVAAGASTWLGGNGHTVDTKGEGIEFELVGRLTRRWSVSLNYSTNKQSDTNIAPFHNAFFVETRAAWERNTTRLIETPANVQTFVRTRDGTAARDFGANPATIADAYAYAQALMDTINRADGQEQMQHLKESFNVFTSFRFGEQASGILRGARIGGGVNYRSSPVIGYDGANNNAPIRGISNLLVSAMAGRTFRLSRHETIDVQLNLQNILGNHKMLPLQARGPGDFIVFNYPRVRRGFDLRAQYKF